MENFPPNSKKSQERARETPKRVERVTSADAVRRKKSLGKQFKATFFGGDAKMALSYVVFNVLLPAAKDALVEAGASGVEKLVYGDSRPKRNRGRGGPSSGPQGFVTYNRMSMGNEEPQRQQRSISRGARARNDFDEIVLSSRSEAEEVIDRLFDLISRYETATLADLYELTGLEPSHTDNKWGWTDLHGACATRIRTGGYLLDLPEPEALN